MDIQPAAAAVRVPHVARAALCPNCEAPRLGPYCQGCGQHHLDGPLRLRTLVRDFLQRKLSLEGGLARTLVDLTLRPGTMIRDYVGGRRQRYINPVGYLFLAAGLYLVALPLWIDRVRADSLAEMGDDAMAVPYVDLLTRLQEYPVALTILTCLFFIPALRYLAGRSITAAEAAVFALYTFSHASILSALAMPLLVLVGASMDGITAVTSILTLVVIGLAADGYFERRRMMIVRVLGAVLLAYAALVISITIGMIAVLVATAAPAAP